MLCMRFLGEAALHCSFGGEAAGEFPSGTAHLYCAAEFKTDFRTVFGREVTEYSFYIKKVALKKTAKRLLVSWMIGKTVEL